jgi:hypothetical protein
MPVARITVVAVSDLGDEVVVWGRPGDGPDDGVPVGYAFQTKGERAEIRLAERASRLLYGAEVVIEYVVIAEDWNLAGGLSDS